MNNAEAINRGKDFENLIRRKFEALPNTLIERMPDPTMGYLGVRNKCDFIAYHFPYVYYLECKTVHSHRLPMANITFNQRVGMLNASKNKGVIAGIICWFIPEDKTVFIPIQVFEKRRLAGDRSINIRKDWDEDFIEIHGDKKRVFYDYNFADFIITCNTKRLGDKVFEY